MLAPDITAIRDALNAITSLLEQPLRVALEFAQPRYPAGSPLPRLLKPHLDKSLHDFMTWLVVYGGEEDMDLLGIKCDVCNPVKILYDLYFME